MIYTINNKMGDAMDVEDAVAVQEMKIQDYVKVICLCIW